ncbi:MAG: hypothetical protein KIS67_13105 [Verrucomicrobiae bacterium]|nr:hypothetical protein [Verrucomicrobiae bacterium]
MFQFQQAAHEPLLGARTALSARTSVPELADKAVRAPGFMAAMRDFTIEATPQGAVRESWQATIIRELTLHDTDHLVAGLKRTGITGREAIDCSV